MQTPRATFWLLGSREPGILKSLENPFKKFQRGQIFFPSIHTFYLCIRNISLNNTIICGLPKKERILPNNNKKKLISINVFVFFFVCTTYKYVYQWKFINYLYMYNHFRTSNKSIKAMFLIFSRDTWSPSFKPHFSCKTVAIHGGKLTAADWFTCLRTRKAATPVPEHTQPTQFVRSAPKLPW